MCSLSITRNAARRHVLGALTVVALAAPALAAPPAPAAQSLPRDGATVLVVRVGGGSVHVSGWRRERIEARVLPNAGAALTEVPPVSLRRDGDRIVAEARLPSQARLAVRVPRAVRVEVRSPAPTAVTVTGVAGAEVSTPSGAVSIARVRDRVEVATGAGAVQVEECTGPVAIATGGGAVTVRRIAGAVEAATGGGALLIERTTGTVEAATGGGAITVSAATGDLELATGGGDLTLEGASRRINATTGSGAIRLHLRRAYRNVNVRLTTGNGSVECRLPARLSTRVSATATGRAELARGEVQQPSAARLTTVLNGGEGTVSLTTGRGDVRISLDGAEGGARTAWQRTALAAAEERARSSWAYRLAPRDARYYGKMGLSAEEVSMAARAAALLGVEMDAIIAMRQRGMGWRNIAATADLLEEDFAVAPPG